MWPCDQEQYGHLHSYMLANTVLYRYMTVNESRQFQSKVISVCVFYGSVLCYTFKSQISIKMHLKLFSKLKCATHIYTTHELS
jgi:hypothetical protein